MMAVQAQMHQENRGSTLCGLQKLMDSSDGFYDLYFNSQLQNINPSRNHNLDFANSPLLSHTNTLSMGFSESLAAQIDKQTMEIDRFILLQNERLRLALQEQRKHHMGYLLRSMESKMLSLLRRKDEDIARATKRTMELQEYLRRVEMENQAWQRVTKENEAMILALNNTLEQVKENVCWVPSAGAEDEESCCDSSDQGHYKKQKIIKDEKEELKSIRKMTCKVCNSRRSCILFLPCRHLCSCKYCETFLDSCPVCNSPKKASMEVRML